MRARQVGLVMATALLGLVVLAGCSENAAPGPPAAQQAAPDTAGTTAAGQPANPPTATDRGRTVEERLEDASLAARVKTALVENRQLRTFEFDPRVTGGRVTLSGNVATRAQGQAAAEVAAGVDGVEEVFNRLTVDGQQVAWNAPDDTTDEPQVAASQRPAAPGPSDGAATGSVYHTVQTGESLWAIANEYGTSVGRIRALNNLRSDGLQPGDRLLVKRGSGSSSASSSGASLAEAQSEQNTSAQEQSSKDASESSSESATSDQEKAAEYYVVKQGESLWAIAQENNMTVARLKELNGLTSNSLMPGDRLRVE